MISVLIPNYNYPCYKLVADLHKQFASEGVPFEIIVAEDGSTQYVEENARMTELDNVRHIIRKENTGRFEMRRFLPTQARYPYLLCMDSDAETVRPDYVRKYVEIAKNGDRAVVSGGLVPPPGLPSPRYSLRYIYGMKREGRQDKKKGLSCFNYMIPAEAAQTVRIEEGLFRHYGHEDTIYGILLKRAGYEIRNIDNPLQHNGLDANEQMLEKSVQAGENLLRCHATGLYPELAEESRLLGLYLKLKKRGLASSVYTLYKIFRHPVKKNLLGSKPSLLLFDFFRLGELISSSRKQL